MIVSETDVFTIDGIAFYGKPDELTVRERPGLYLLPEGVTGWTGGVPIKSEAAERSNADGQHSTPIYYGARITSWNAIGLAKSEGELTRLGDRVTGIGDRGREFTVTGQHGGRVLSSRARIGVSPSAPRRRQLVSGLFAADVSFQLVHDDPYLYGDEQPAVAGVVVIARHDGNTDAWADIEVTGYWPNGYTITGPGGRTYQVASPLTSGKDVVSMRSGRTRRNGVLLPNAITKGRTWPIPKYTDVQMQIGGAGGSGAIRPTVRDTII